jgi:hypothetical protein
MLVIDRREIEFDAAALTYYLTILPAETEKLGLSRTPPSEFRFDPEDSVVEAVYREGGQVRTVVIPSETLGAILVNFCLRMRIPLPRVANKFIRVRAASVVLSFKTWFEEAPVFVEAKEAMRAVDAAKSWKWVEPGQPAAGF